MSKSNNSFSGKKREKNKIETSSSGSDEKNDLAGSTVKIVFKSQKMVKITPETETKKNGGINWTRSSSIGKADGLLAGIHR